jgi:hypothetical protein
MLHRSQESFIRNKLVYCGPRTYFISSDPNTTSTVRLWIPKNLLNVSLVETLAPTYMHLFKLDLADTVFNVS